MRDFVWIEARRGGEEDEGLGGGVDAQLHHAAALGTGAVGAGGWVGGHGLEGGAGGGVEGHAEAGGGWLGGGGGVAG